MGFYSLSLFLTVVVAEITRSAATCAKNLNTSEMLAIVNGRCITFNFQSKQPGCQYNCSHLVSLLNISLTTNETNHTRQMDAYKPFVDAIVNTTGCFVTLPNQALLWSGCGPGSPIGDMSHVLSLIQVDNNVQLIRTSPFLAKLAPQFCNSLLYRLAAVPDSRR